MDISLPLVEYFYSIQGEGYNAGRAAFFVRFAGCNLNCIFAEGAICDTPWHKAQVHITIGDLLEWMHREHRWRDFEDKDAKPMVILTGGEPTMAKAFDDLVQVLWKFDYYIAVESNGTIWRESLDLVDHLVVSPKTHIEHGPHAGNPAVNGNCAVAAAEWRHVITGRDDPIPLYNEDVYNCVSPALEADGTGMEHLRGAPPRFVPGAVERCLEIIHTDPRFRLSLQTHKWIRVR